MAERSQDVITKDVVSKAVARQFGQSLEKIVVKKFEISEGSKVGDNYASDVKRITGNALVDGQDEAFDYIAKVQPVDKASQEMMGSVSVDGLNTISYRFKNFKRICNPVFKNLPFQDKPT